MYKAIEDLGRFQKKELRQIIRKYRPEPSSLYIVNKINMILSTMTKYKIFKN